MAQFLQFPFCDQEVVGSIHVRVIPKTFSNGTALSLGAQHKESRAKTGQPGVSGM